MEKGNSLIINSYKDIKKLKNQYSGSKINWKEKGIKKLFLNKITLRNGDKLNEICKLFDLDQFEKIFFSFKFRYDYIYLTKSNGLIILGIYNFNNDIYDILTNLSIGIDILYLNIDKYVGVQLPNLSVNLKKIIVNISDYDDKREYYETNGYFNFLFNLKIPFGCKIEVRTKTKDYLKKSCEIYEVDIYSNKLLKLKLKEYDLVEKEAEIINIPFVIVNPTSNITVDYIYLNSAERQRFANVGHQYLIEQKNNTSSSIISKNDHIYILTLLTNIGFE